MHNYIRVMIMKALNLNSRKESPVREKAKRSFIRAFGRAAAVVLISSGLMVGCAGNNSNVRSDSAKQTEVAKADAEKPTKSILELSKEVYDYREQEMELIVERDRLIREKEEARAKKEEARAKKEEARAKKEAALKRAAEACKDMADILDEMVERCREGEEKYCGEEYKKRVKIYEKQCVDSGVALKLGE